MKLDKNYRLAWLEGVPYLLPFGQAAANLQRGVRLNSSGVFLWKLLQEGATKEELLAQMIAKYHPEEEELPLLRQDVESFLNKMTAFRILLPERKLTAISDRDVSRELQIGGITLEYRGPEGLFAPEFEPFCKASAQVDLYITAVRHGPFYPAVGQMLIRSRELMIVESGQAYHCIYPEQNGLTEWSLTKDGREAILYCREPFSEEIAQKVFHAIRMIYLVLAQKKGLYAIHSASLLYRGRAWLFSGHSGAGKSTHTALWAELFQTPLLNGDLNLVEPGRGDDASHAPMVYGIPWCGTSGISTTQSYPLGGIAFVRRHPKNIVSELTGSERELSILQRVISPGWTEEMFLKNLEFSQTLAPQIPLFRLCCTKEVSAAVEMKQIIDDIFQKM